MTFQTNTELVGFPAISQKLKITFPEKQTLGSGFIVGYKDREWLVTCWHNLGPLQAGSTLDLTGEMTAESIAFVNPATINLDLKNRAIIGVRKGRIHADIAAIELHAGERPDMPWFQAQMDMDLKGFAFPTHMSIGGYDTTETVNVPILTHYAWQGFPGTDLNATPRTFRAADFPNSRARHSWMLKYTPSAYGGASGCPVFKLEGEVMALVGVQVHKYSQHLEFDGIRNSTGKPVKAFADMEWGGAVPIEYIYRGIDHWLETGDMIVSL
ncbi:hypothetical protein [Asticcacaulis sp.]|uniref:hypothetical protein n=1 Tax=Asticcacaulis sp. TaxID=1872648 RepID=UPI003F7C0152